MKIYTISGNLIGEFDSIADAVKSGAKLRKADLIGLDLSGSDLTSADLRKANLREAKLSGATLRDADLSNAVLSGADTSGGTLRNAKLRGSNLIGADLSGATLSEACWINAVLTNCVGGPWHFGLGRHTAIVHDGKISIGCKTETITWWLENYRQVGERENYSPEEIAKYGAWIKFVAQQLQSN